MKHVIDIVTRVNQTKKENYTIAWQDTNMAKLLQIKLHKVYTDHQMSQSDIVKGQELSFVQYLQCIF